MWLHLPGISLYLENSCASSKAPPPVNPLESLPCQEGFCSVSLYTGLGVTPLRLSGLGMQAGLLVPGITNPGPTPGPDS